MYQITDWSKVTHDAGNTILDDGKLFSDEEKRSPQGFSRRKYNPIWGVHLAGRGMFSVTKAGHANMGRVDDCFQGKNHYSRETGRPKKPQGALWEAINTA